MTISNLKKKCFTMISTYKARDLLYRKREVIRTLSVVGVFCFLCPESLSALTSGAADGAKAIEGVDKVWKSVTPYITGLFSAGGVIYSGINLRKVVMGDYRAAAPAAIAAVVASLGINGMFGENALSVLLP